MKSDRAKRRGRGWNGFERLEPRQMLAADYLALDLAKFQSTTVDSTADSWESEATDGIVSNQSSWVSATGSGGHWLEVELTAAYPVGSAHLYLGIDDGSTVSSFEVQYHDGADWETLVSVTGNTATDLNLLFPETIDDATRYRFYTTDSVARVKEFVLLPPTDDPAGHPLGTGVELNLAAQRAPLASSTAGDSYPILTVDGYTGDESGWTPSSASGTHQIEFPLTGMQEVGSLHLHSGVLGSRDPSPLADFTIEYWDGSAWALATDITPSDGSTRGAWVFGNTSTELEVVFNTPIDTNNIRLTFADVAPLIREVVVIPAGVANTGQPGYELGVSTIEGNPPAFDFTTFGDDWRHLESRSNGGVLSSDTTQTWLAGRDDTEVDRQYQLLYSYSLDAFRILNRESGLTLEVADASVEAGAAIVEGDYSAAPHQLWRLVATSGGYYQVINVWSGMAIELSESSPYVATQQEPGVVNNPGESQEWRFDLQEDYFKKGTGGWVGSFNTSWAYDWARNNQDGYNPEFFYAPMQHREGWPNLGTLHRRYADWNNDVWPAYLLGFNEPDRPDQADMGVGRGIELWPQLTAMDVPLVSPAPALGGEDWWLTDFMDRADNLGYRVDYAGGHWYSGPSVDSLFAHINDLQNDGNGRDVWLTEFSVVDWSNGSGDWSEETNYNFILNFLWRAETKNNLDKYAIFIFSGGSPTDPWTRSNPRSNFRDSNGNLTPFGRAYAAWDGDTSVQDDTSYILHNRAAYHRLQNSGRGTLAYDTIRSEDVSVQWSVQDAGNGRKHIVSNLDGSLLRYSNGVLDYAPAGTTGADVEWRIDQEQYGWHNIIHSDSGLYLRLNRTNDSSGAPVSIQYEMVTASEAANYSSTDWHFVKPWSSTTPFDETPPEVVGADFQWDTDQSIDVTFSESIDTNGVDFTTFTLTNLDTGATLSNRDLLVVDLTPDGFTIDMRELPLADGLYHLEFAEAAFTDTSGNGNVAFETTFGVLTGDANNDGVVDNDDADLWRSDYGSTSSLASDFNRDGVVDAADYTLWRANQGATLSEVPSDIVGAVAVESARAAFAPAVREVAESESSSSVSIATLVDELPDSTLLFHVRDRAALRREAFAAIERRSAEDAEADDESSIDGWESAFEQL